jgi:hypothetical protein
LEPDPDRLFRGADPQHYIGAYLAVCPVSNKINIRLTVPVLYRYGPCLVSGTLPTVPYSSLFKVVPVPVRYLLLELPTYLTGARTFGVGEYEVSAMILS